MRHALTHLAVAGGTLYATDYTMKVVRAIDLATRIERPVAGTGSVDGFYGDGGPATSAGLKNPRGISTDLQGNVFIADAWNRRIRKVSLDGTITTIAAGVDPNYLTVDGKGDVYFTERSVVRKIEAGGAISTVAGGGTSPLQGGQAATSGSLHGPMGVDVDAGGNLYVADYNTGRVWKVGTDGMATDIPRRAAGGAPSSWPWPTAVRFRPDGTLLVLGQTQLFAVDLAGNATVVAGSGTWGMDGDGGRAVSARLGDPTDVVFDGAGNIYVANVHVRRIGTDGTITALTDQNPSTAYWEGKPAGGVELPELSAVAAGPDGSVYIGQASAGVLRKVDRSGAITTAAGGGIDPPAEGVSARSVTVSPVVLTFDPHGTLYFADDRRQVFRIDGQGILRLVAGGGGAPCYYWQDCAAGDGGPATAAQFVELTGLAVSADGTVYIADAHTNRIRRVTPSGIISTIAGGPTAGFSGDGGPSTAARLARPASLQLDAAGNLYFTDTGNGRVRKIDTGGTITTVASIAARGIALDRRGNLFASDWNRIRRVDVDGMTTIVAGNGALGFWGDGGPAVDAGLTFPGALAIDVDGGLLIADEGNHRVRRVHGVTDVRPADASAGRYHPLAPARILDTRDGTGGVRGPVGSNATVVLDVTGVGGVPSSGVSAVVLNVTVTSPAQTGFLTVFPSGTSRPLASNVNFVPGQTVPNLVMARVGGNGNVAIYNSAGPTSVVADVVGWYGASGVAGGSRLTSLSPSRILDTRVGTGGSRAPVGPASTIALTVTGVGGVPAADVAAVVLNVTATEPSGVSFLTVFPSGTPRPLASNLNFQTGDTVPNLVVAKVGADGKVAIYNNAGSTHVVADVVGWFGRDGGSAGSTYEPLPPARVLDTRGPNAPIGPGGTVTVDVTGAGGVPATGAVAVVLNVTATQPSTGGFLTVFPSGTSRPLASNLNVVAGETRPNLVVAKVGADGSVKVYNNSGTTHLVVDVAGWYRV
ncbi:MAG TPA: hypothetical protein VM388_13985 [Acidimicrobiales bacterium]|nr:hypothetical protein [Acidimicrobiales bacterium]